MNKNIPSHETKMEPLVSFPYNAFLMVRLEYVQILRDDLQAKLLRIIEAHIETQRLVLYREAMNKSDSNQPIDIPKDIYVPISYKLFMNDLFGLVSSENTIKKNLNILISYKIIFRKEAPKKKYAPPEYSINTTALQMLLDALKNPGYQSLIPSILDTLKLSYPQELIPSWYQLLIPSILKSSSDEKSRVSQVDTTIRLEEDYSSKNESPDPSPIPSSPQSSPIATTPTGNDPMPDLPSKQRNTEPLLTAEERRVFDLLCEVFYAIPPEVITPKIKKQCADLAPHVRNAEDLKSLRDYARLQIDNDPNAMDKQIYLGNLIKAVNGWKQKQTQERVTVLEEKKRLRTEKQVKEEWNASLRADPWAR